MAFFHTGWIGADWLGTSSTSLGEWHRVLAAWQTPSLQARQRKQLRHREPPAPLENN